MSKVKKTKQKQGNDYGIALIKERAVMHRIKVDF
jgi:hypothetical protein